MKTITVNVSEPVYEDFRQYARKVDRTASELIREAMEHYRQVHMQRRTSLQDRRPASVGGPIRSVTGEDDLLDTMLAATFLHAGVKRLITNNECDFGVLQALEIVNFRP